MATTHALFVGINKYHPRSRVSPLAGCVNDIKAFQEFLVKNYPNVVAHMLLNAQATRTNILQTFTAELIKKAKKGDTVLFYYAGHGSFAPSATPFKDFDPKAQDETFVCYDSRLPGHFDLTDKELAVLLSRIAEGVHIVVIADSCHSASITRNVARPNLNLKARRFTKGRSEERSLQSYLLEGDNYYQEQLDQTGAISIPHATHILLSACDREEEAWETTERRGLFSTILLDTLKQNRNLSYSDIFERVRHQVYNTSKNQQPTIYPLEGFNPNTVFLQQDIRPNRKRHLIAYKNEQWRLAFGGIHGLPTASFLTEKISIGIYEGISENKEQLLQSKVTKVLLNEAILATQDTRLDTSKTYWGEVETLPTSMLVNLEGKAHHIAKFLKKYNQAPSSFIQFIKNYKAAPYTLKVWSRNLEILYTDTRKLLHGKKGMSVPAAKYITQQLEHIYEWERIAQLDNQEAAPSLKKAIEVQFFEEKEDGQLEAYTDREITLDYWKSSEDKDSAGNVKPVWYQLQAKNTSKKDLYVSLLHLSSKFGVQSHFKSQVIPANSGTIILDKDHGIVISDPRAHQTTDIFKVIVSTEPFDDHKYQLDAIEVGVSRDLISRPRVAVPKEDWCTQTIKVNTLRKQNTIGDTSIRFKSEGLQISAHPDFKADVAFTALKSPAGSRSIQRPMGFDALADNEAIQIINLAKSSSRRRFFQDKSIIELSGIENRDALKKQPLTITVDQDLSETENIIPVTIKNGYLIPFGASTKSKDGKVHISISDLPDADAVPSTSGKRSLGKALWFALLKISGLRDKAFKLRKVAYDEAGNVKRNQINLLPSIDKAEKILLVIHGIIGDTKPILSNLQFLLEQQHYDLILSYDYENLNEPIENIAIELNKRLKKYNIGANDGKTVDILAHSMGGLVSRYMIEQIRKGDNAIDRLFMFGTPNGGSVFGDIPAYRDMLTKLMTFALNFGKPWLGPLAGYMSGVNKALIATKALTVTLEQMSPTSPFIEGLYKNSVKGHTTYTIVAGDTTAYKNKKDSLFSEFMETVVLKVGNLANSNTPNDIAALVEQIKALPPDLDAQTHDICCHHLNYFDEGAGLDTLRTIVSKKE